MLEKIAAELLAKYLDKYVHGLEEQNLTISILDGKVQLANLRLKNDALDDLELPVTITEGYLQELELEIPWKNLKFETAVLRIKGIYLQAGPKNEFDEKSAKEKVQATKQRLLQIAELMAPDTEKSNNNNNNQNNQSYLTTVTNSLMNNLQIHIEDVHFRYVESDDKFNFGLKFKYFKAQTTNEEWKPIVISSSEAPKITYRLAKLSQLSFYWNTQSSIRENKDRKSYFHHLMEPIDVCLKITMNNKTEVAMKDQKFPPKAVVHCSIERFEFKLDENQYSDMIHLVKRFSNYRKSLMYLKYRPTIGTAKEYPQHWWKYAIQSIMQQVSEKNKKSQWSYIREITTDKRRYVELYAKKKLLESEKCPLSEEEQTEMLEIEGKYDVDLLIIYRNLANRFFEKLLKERKEKIDNIHKQKSWFGRMFATNLPIGEVKLNYAQLAKLDAEIGIDKEIAVTTAKPPEYVEYKLSFELNESSFAIKGRDLLKLISFHSSKILLNAEIREKGQAINVIVGTFSIKDHFSPETFFPEILFSNQNSDAIKSGDILDLSIDIKPLQKDSDMDIRLFINSTTIVVPIKLIRRLIHFFKDGSSDSSWAIEFLAQEKLQQLREQATTQITDLFVDTKKIDILINIPSSKVLVPRNTKTLTSPILILDSGNISFERFSDPLSVVNETAHYYEEFLLRIQRSNAFLASINDYLNSPVLQENCRIIHNFDVDAKTQICKVKSSKLAPIKMFANLPHFVAEFSVESISNILLIADSLLSKQQNSNRDYSVLSKVLSEISSYEVRQAEFAFSITKFEVLLTHTAPSSLISRHSYVSDLRSFIHGQDNQPLKQYTILNLNLDELAVTAMITNHCTKVTAKLSEAAIRTNNLKDLGDYSLNNILFSSVIDEAAGCSKELVATINEVKDDTDNALILIDYIAYPSTSPLLEKYLNVLTLQFNSIHVMVDLDNFLIIQNYVDQIMNKFEAQKKQSKALSAPQPNQQIEILNGVNLLKFEGRIYRVAFTIPIENQPVLEVSFASAQVATVISMTEDISACGKMGKVTMRYIDPEINKYFSKVLVISGDDLFKFHFAKYNLKKNGEDGNQKSNNNNDGGNNEEIPIEFDIMLEIGKMEYYYFHSLTMRMLDHFNKLVLNSKENDIKNADGNEIKPDTPIKFKVNISIESPRVIVPTICKGENGNGFVEGISMRLGKKIAIQSSLLRRSSHSHPFLMHSDNDIVEHFDINISNFSLETFSLNQIHSFPRHIVTDVDIFIKMEMDHGITGDAKKIYMLVDIPNISFNITRYQLGLLADILSNNFLYDDLNKSKFSISAPPNDENKPKSGWIIPKKKSEVPVANLHTTTRNVNAPHNEVSYLIKTKDKIKQESDLKVACRFPKFQLIFSDGDGADPQHIFSNVTQTCHSSFGSYSPLVSFSFKNSEITFRSFNKVSQAEIIADTYNFNDLRSGANHNYFKSLIAPSMKNIIQDNPQPKEAFFLKFESKDNEESSTMITFQDPELILIMDAWIDIGIYFQLFMPDLDRILSSVQKILNPANISSPTPSKTEVYFIQPEICMVENSTTEDTKCFIFHSDKFKFSLFGIPKTRSTMIVTSFNTEIYLSNMVDRENVEKIVRNFDFNIQIEEQINISSTYQVDLLSSVIFYVSFSNYLIFDKIFKGYQLQFDKFTKFTNDLKLANNPAENNNTIDNSSTNNIIILDHSLSDSIVHSSSDLLNSSNNNNSQLNLATQTQQVLILNTEMIRVILSTYDENSDIVKTLLSINVTSINGRVANWANIEQMVGQMTTNFSVNYLNQKQEAFEPMVEPISITLQLRDNPKILFTNIDTLNINLTYSFVDTLMNTIKAINNVLNKEKDEQIYSNNNNNLSRSMSNLSSSTDLYSSKRFLTTKYTQHPYHLINETGMPIYYYFANDHEKHDKVQLTSGFSINSNTVNNLPDLHISSKISHKEEIGFYEQQVKGSKLHVSLQPFGFFNIKELDSISVDKIATSKLKLLSIADKSISSCEVAFRNSSKVITLRSNRIFTNSLEKQTLYLKISSGNFEDHIPIAPRQSISVPLTHFQHSFPRYSLTVNANEYPYPAMSDFIKDHTMYSVTPKDPRNYVLHFLIKKYIKDGDHCLEIVPLCTVENSLSLTLTLLHSGSVNGKSIQFQKTIESGCSEQILEFPPLFDTSFPIRINLPAPFGLSKPYDLKLQKFTKQSDDFLYFDGEGEEFCTRILSSSENMVSTVSLFSDYWISNRSYLPLQFHRPLSSKSFIPYLRFLNENNREGRVLMYTDNSKLRFVKSSALVVKTSTSNWSGKFSLEMEGTLTPLELTEDYVEKSTKQKKTKVYDLIIKNSISKNFFYRTKLISIHPKYIIVNQTPEVLTVAQFKTSHTIKVSGNSYAPLYWGDNSLSIPRFIFRFRDSQNWSTDIDPKILRDIAVKVGDQNNNTTSRYSVSIRQDSQKISMLIVISYLLIPQYLIQNNTPYTFQFREPGTEEWDEVEPGKEKEFTYFDPINHDTLNLQYLNDKASIELTGISEYMRNRRLKFTNMPPVFWSLTMNPKGNKGKILKLDMNIPRSSTFFIQKSLSIGSIYLSLIDETPQEFLLLTVNNTKFTETKWNSVQKYQLFIENIQIDNQLPCTPYPVLFTPKRRMKREPLKSSSDQLLELSTTLKNPPTNEEPNAAFINNQFLVVSLGNVRTDESTYLIDECHVEIKPFEIKFDEEIIVRLMSFISTLSFEENNIEVNEYQQLAESNALKEEKQLLLYFKTFRISEITFEVSFLIDSVSEGGEGNRLLPVYLRPLANIEGTEITLDALPSKSFVVPPSELFNLLSTYYKILTRRTIFSTVIGSDFLGNPKTLVTGIRSGITDFVSMPTSEIVNNSSSVGSVGSAVIKGSKSLGQNTIYALSNTTSKLTASLAGIASSFDGDSQSERDWKNAREKPQNIGQGTKQGLKSLGKGFMKGAVGVVADPIKGAKEGKRAALKGLAKGTSGLILKPTVGVLDSVSKFSEGIKNNVKITDNEVNRVRFPRYIAPDDILRPFNASEAELQFQFQIINSFKYSREKLLEFFVFEKCRIFLCSKYLVIFWNVEGDMHIEEYGIEDFKRSHAVTCSSSTLTLNLLSTPHTISVFHGNSPKPNYSTTEETARTLSNVISKLHFEN